MPFTKILIAVDDSAEGMKAARCGFELAHCFNAAVGVLYVVDKNKEVINADIGITPEESKYALRQEAHQTIEQYIKMFDGGTEVFRFIPEGIPDKEILNIAEEWRADLIVMGAHTRSRIDRILTGSMAEHVIRHAHVPVVVTPPHMR